MKKQQSLSQFGLARSTVGKPLGPAQSSSVYCAVPLGRDSSPLAPCRKLHLIQEPHELVTHNRASARKRGSGAQYLHLQRFGNLTSSAAAQWRRRRSCRCPQVWAPASGREPGLIDGLPRKLRLNCSGYPEQLDVLHGGLTTAAQQNVDASERCFCFFQKTAAEQRGTGAAVRVAQTLCKVVPCKWQTRLRAGRFDCALTV